MSELLTVTIGIQVESCHDTEVTRLSFDIYRHLVTWDDLVMSIFNRFFDDRLNRVSKNLFFYDFLKFDFD